MKKQLKIGSSTIATLSVGMLCLSFLSTPAWAEGEEAPAAWVDTIAFSGHVEGGITANPDSKDESGNFGALFEDKANQPLLNQLMLTLQRPTDTQCQVVDVGFTLQGMFGSDARFTHGFNEMDHLINSRYQLDIVQATVDLHIATPDALATGGMDVKIGQFPSPMGAESIDATSNALYSHSYIFNFGVPYKNTGFLTTTHISPVLDLYAGLDTGVNAWVGSNGYNNHLIKGQFGVGLNLLGGNLTILALSHIGAENPANLAGVTPNALRYLNDITTIWKANDNLTLTTDINYITDNGLGANGYGVAQYAAYKLNDKVSLVGRGEVWRDNSGAFVSSVAGHFDYVNAERGLPATVTGGGRTTYGELTLGVNYKPDLPHMKGLIIRPEIRVDDSLNGTHPYNNGRDSHSFTPAIDLVYSF